MMDVDCRCRELGERNKMDGERSILLDLDDDRRKSEFELLESKFRELEAEKVSMHYEVTDLKRRNVELEEKINQFEKENGVVSEEVLELKIENCVLQCEKKSAERQSEVWKLKCAELESQVLELEKGNLALRSLQSQLAGMPEMQTEDRMENSSPVKGIGDLHAAGTPFMEVSSMQFAHANPRTRGLVSETEKNHNSRVRKQLEFGEVGSLNVKLAPPTPGVARPPSFGIIDISDSDNEVATTSLDAPCDVNRMMAHVSTEFSAGDTMPYGNKKASDGNFKRTLSHQIDEEDMKEIAGSFPCISTPKRKRATNIVTTDSESDSDDNIPIRKMLKRKYIRESNSDSLDSHLNPFPVNATLSEEEVRESTNHRRRLVPLRECSTKNKPEQKSCSNSSTGGASYDFGIPTSGCVENDEVEDDDSEPDTEGENLGGFIVNSSDISENNDGSNGSDIAEADDGSNESEDLSDDNVGFNEVLSKIGRSRGHKVEWEFEADMLAAFSKDPELCMKAVCALYRKQTVDEKIGKFTYYLNGQGFSQFDAKWGSKLAQFLIGGDPEGDVKKSVEELREYNSEAPEICSTLASRYSKQLFAIYKSKEDPFFLPS